MGQPNEEVDIPGLTKVGGAVTAAADGFRTAYAQNEGQLTAGNSPDGWAAGAQLQQAGTAWQTFTGTLAEHVRTFGDGLTQTAKEFQAADQAAADRVTAAGGGPQPR